MTEFLIVGCFLCLLAVAFAILPLRSGRQGLQPLNRKGSNVAAYKARLHELQQESEDAHYGAEQSKALQDELELRLLDDVTDTVEQQGSSMRLWPVVGLIFLLIPLGSWGLYQQLGAGRDLMLAEQLSAFKQSSSEAEISVVGGELIATLKQRLGQQQDSPSLWMLLGRAQTRLQDYASAQDSFQQLMQITGEDPIVMGLYAQARYMAAGRQLDEVAKSIAERALEIQPNNGTVLGMLGMSSFEGRDYSNAIKYWQQLLALLDPGSTTAQMIMRGVQQAKAAAGDGLESESTDEIALTVSVTMDDGLKLPEEAMVFIYARAVNGPKMPLAVVKRAASALPITVTLDETMAMTPAMSLANFDQVELVARVSSGGIANSAPGDLEGVVGPVNSASKSVVNVLIDRVLD